MTMHPLTVILMSVLSMLAVISGVLCYETAHCDGYIVITKQFFQCITQESRS